MYNGSGCGRALPCPIDQGIRERTPAQVLRSELRPRAARRYLMKIELNPDEKVVATIKEGLKQKGGYCPCRLERTEDNKCMCKEFRDQIADPDFEGFCHCMLYYKRK